MPLVRPFAGWVVRPEWAARLVRPLEGDSGLDSAFDLAAYEPAPRPTVYAYRMPEGGRLRTSLVVQVATAGFSDGRVLGHEAVQPARVSRLVDVFDATPYRTDLVSLVHRVQPDLAALLGRAVAERPPMLELTDLSGLAQAVWPLSPAESDAVVELVAGVQLYVADGHHRVAASLQRWERAGRPDGTVACAVYAEDQVELYAFHRRVAGRIDGAGLLARLSAAYDVRPTAGPTQERGVFGIYVGGRWHRAQPLAAQRLAGVAGLDVTLLDESVLGPVLGVHRGDARLEPVPEVRDIAETVRRCDADGGALFTLRGPTVGDLVDVAERRETMSAKTTLVQPKPRTGVFLSDGS
ncbi:MAG: DUF1015 family protein [Actinomycetales bacterium]